MKSVSLFLLLLCILLLCSSWGFFAHQRINELAVYTLPQPIVKFYKLHIKHIKMHATDADKRRYADTLEAPRHYLDVEHYAAHIDSIPKRWPGAESRYGAAHLNRYGIIPWHTYRVYLNLVNAWAGKDIARILRYSSDLGHYIADAHVPLHTTNNHNGQLTNQHGLHAFWESRIPELFSGGYNFIVGKAGYIDNVQDKIWEIVKQSRSLVHDVLSTEAALNATYPPDKKYSFERRNNTIIKQYSSEYARCYQNAMNGMVEQRMRSAIWSVGSLWYSAWVDAGQPEIPLSPIKQSARGLREKTKEKAGKRKRSACEI
jgi:hypothetical protein